MMALQAKTLDWIQSVASLKPMLLPSKSFHCGTIVMLPGTPVHAHSRLLE